MSKGTILVTDSLFIHAEHVKQMEDAGYKVVRLDKPEVTEDELAEYVKGKVGYILGGVEHVTEKIIDSADKLKAIVFTGVDYHGFIPAADYAQSKGIKLLAAADGPTHAVVEWMLTMALAMNRRIFDLGRVGKESFMTTPGIENAKVGIFGFGRVGTHLVESLKVFRPASISYFSKHRHEDIETALRATYKGVHELLQESDIVFLCIPDAAGKNFFSKEHFNSMKNGSLLVSVTHPGVIDADSLFVALNEGRIRAVLDYPPGDKFNDLPLSSWYNFNGSNAFNTKSELKYCSQLAVDLLLKELAGKDDQYIVNK